MKQPEGRKLCYVFFKSSNRFQSCKVRKVNPDLILMVFPETLLAVPAEVPLHSNCC